jgi:hypothetical protein
MTNTTSRRALLTAAAAVPAIALLPAASGALAAAPTVADPVIELAEHVMQTHDAYVAACEAWFGAPDAAMTEWRKNNPLPDLSADDTAVARWRRRERAAERRTGYAKVEANKEAAGIAARDAIYTLRDAVPTTLAGLAAKARAWRYLEKDIKEQADELVYSVASDISVMAGQPDRGVA